VYGHPFELRTTTSGRLIFMQRLTVTCITLVALLAVGATLSSSASAEKLTMSEGATALPPGDPVWFEGDDALRIEASGVECPRSGAAEVGLGVLTNSRQRDTLALNYFDISGRPLCRSFTGNAEAGLLSLGRVVKLRATGEATVGPVAVEIHFEHEEYKEREYENFSCVYTRNALSGTNTATATAQALHVTFEGELKLKAASSSEDARHLCPGEAEMSLTLPRVEGETGIIEEQIAP
jgi:hypothetical protein